MKGFSKMGVEERSLRRVPSSWAIVLLILLAALLRFYKLGYVNLEGHTEALVNLTYDLIHRGIFPAHFLPLGNFGHYGPLLLYLFAPIMALTKNPYSVFVFTIILHLAAIYLLYRLIADFFGRRGALVAVGLYAFSFYSLTHSRLPSPENLLPFFVLLFLYSLFAIKLKRSTLYYVTLFASCAAFLQIHITAFPLALLVPVLFLSRPSVKWVPMLVGLAILVASFWPYANYEMKHDYPETREMVRLVTGRSELSHKLRTTLSEEPEPLLDLTYLRKFFTLEKNPVHMTQAVLLCSVGSVNAGSGALRQKMIALNGRIMRNLAVCVLAMFAAGLTGLLIFTGLSIAGLRPVHPGDLFKSGSILAWFFLSILLLMFLPYQSHTHHNVVYLSMVAVVGVSFDHVCRFAKGVARRIVGIAAAVIALGYASSNVVAYLHATELGSQQNCISIKSAESIPLSGKMEIGNALAGTFPGYLKERTHRFRGIPVYSERLSYLTGMPIGLSYYLDREMGGAGREMEGSRPIFLIVKSSNQPYPRPRALFSKSIGGYEIIGAVPLIEREGWTYRNREEPGWQDAGFDDSGWDRVDLPANVCIGSTFSAQCKTFSDYAPFFWRGWMQVDEPGQTSLLLLGVYGFHLSELYINGRAVEEVSRFTDDEKRALRYSPAARIFEEIHRPKVVEIGGELVQGANLIAVKYEINEKIRPAETNVFKWDLFDISSAPSPDTGQRPHEGTNSFGD